MKTNSLINLVAVLSVSVTICGSSRSNRLQERYSNDVLLVNNENDIPTPDSADTDLNETLSQMQASGRKFMHAALATNLTVTTRVYNSTRRLLEMVVAWEPPKNGRFPDSYNLHVIPLNESDPYCRTDYYYAFINDPLAKTWKVPDAFYLLQEGIQVLPECTYSVNLESNPHNGKHSAIATYTVPECVQNVCSCRHASTIIRPEIRATLITNFAVNITWILLGGDKRSETITKFILGIGNQIMKSSSQRIVYNVTWVREIRYVKDLLFYHHLYVLPAVGNYMVAVYAVDNRTCTGPVSNFTFTVPDDPHPAIGTFTKSEMVWMTVLPSASFLLAVCIAAIVVGQRCLAWSRRRFFHTDVMQQARLQSAHNWRGVYKAVSLESNRSSRINFPSLQERNVLYVEKEIEDAKTRGEADTYEISYNRLTLGREIGKGAFGRVFLATAEAIVGVPGNMIVAVKKLKNRANADALEEFQAEIAMMKRVGRHPNIVTMLGCCTIKQPYCMVMEYVPCGDLLQYLRRLRVEYDLRRAQLRPHNLNLPRYGDGVGVGVAASTITDSSCSYITPDTPKTMSFTLSSGRPSITEGEWSMQSSFLGSSAAHHRLEYVLDPRELQSFAVQIARGMAFLEEKQITHRDLAARNILIDEKKTLKISDFGLSRSGIYVNTKRRKVPLRWLSIEAMRDSLYSSKSDVWASGIVLWEIGTLGGFPYPTVSDYDLLNFLMDGKRLEKPENISEELYSVMTVCWSHSADERPSFADLVSYLDSNSRKQVYVDFNELKPEYKFPPTEQLFKKTAASNNNVNNKPI